MMRKSVLSALFAALVLSGVGGSLAQDTGLTPNDPVAKVAARKGLMGMVAVMVEEMKLSAQDGKFDPLATSERGAVLAAMFRAFPQLFPTDSNFLARDESPEIATGANPQIWEDYAAFAGLAETSATQAEAASVAEDPVALQKAVKTLETTCISCHSSYYMFAPVESPYATPPK